MVQFSEPSGITLSWVRLLLDFCLLLQAKTHTHTSFDHLQGKDDHPVRGLIPLVPRAPHSGRQQSALVFCPILLSLTTEQIDWMAGWHQTSSCHTVTEEQTLPSMPPLSPGEMWEPCIPVPLSGPILPDKEVATGAQSFLSCATFLSPHL